MIVDRKKPTKLGESIRQALDELEQWGLIRRTGEFRRGKPVFVITELGHTRLDLPHDDKPLLQ
jgi:DNA-binding PadR family transcriptional regulator